VANASHIVAFVHSFQGIAANLPVGDVVEISVWEGFWAAASYPFRRTAPAKQLVSKSLRLANALEKTGPP